jgi:hypothetical protein
MDLSDREKDLLRLLVSGDGLTGGKQFNLVQSAGGYGLTYPSGPSVSIEFDDIDFRQLRKKRLIEFISLAPNRWRGKPTELGVTTTRRGFHSRRLMRDFEARCALLSLRAREVIQERGEKLEIRLSDEIEVADATLRHFLSVIEDERGAQKEAAEAAFRDKMSTLRRRITDAAASVAEGGVREFAEGLLTSQGRLGADYILVRRYTAQLVNLLRNRINYFPACG